MKKTLWIGLSGFLALASAALAANYGVFVGLNQYSSSYIDSSSWLDGCVPDAMHVYTNATHRGSWTAGNSQVLTNALGTRTRIRQAISNYAATAVSGDVFLYFHSSHGGNNDWPYSTSVYLCAYDANYTDTLLAQDLSKFATGVKVVVMVDACHSGGLFQSRAVGGEPTLASDTPPVWDLAARVTELMEADRAAKLARGVKDVDKLISASEIGWVTAANYDQYSWDDTDGGAFTTAAIAGWTNGTCDNATYGDQNGYANFYEVWNYAKDIAIGYPGEVDPNDGTSYATDAQAYNTNVLKSIVAGVAGDGPVADQPPTIALNPAGTNKTVTFANPLSFTVTATDGDGLAVALSASGLPSGATAPATNGTGSVATTFNWTPAEAQVGVHQFSFSATDDDGTTTVGVKVTVTDGSTTADLFISEYVEGSSSEKYIEIFNGTGADVDLSNYRLQLYGNGTNVANPSVTLSGTLANGAVKVYRNTSASNYSCDANTAVNFNGDDAVALYKISSAAYVDIVGRIGEDPGTAWTSGSLSTLNQTLVRKSTVASGITENPASGFPTLATEWDTYAQDTVSHLGSHTFGGGGTTTSAPAFNALGGQSATVGKAASFTVSATGNPAPTLALQGTTASAGYTFTAGTGLLAYTPPEADLGDRTFTFTASNVAGVATQTVAVTVAASTDLLAPVVQAASGIQAAQFNANWLAAANATGYRLDVATNGLFRHTMGKRTATLAAGDLMIVTADADATEGFDAVPLVDLDAGTVIYFTDNGWSNGVWRATEGVITYTAPGAIAAGTVLSYRSTNENGFVKSGSFDLSASGDTILAYQGPTNSPTFLFGVGWAMTTPWIESGTVSANSSMIPAGLSSNTYTIVSCGASDNYQYNSANGTAGSPGSLLQWVANAGNWTANDTTPFAKFTPDFTVGVVEQVNDFVAGYESRDAGAATTCVVTGLTEGVTYYYRVKAYNASSNSPFSGTTSVVTVAGSTPAPQPIAIGHGPGGGGAMSLQIPTTVGVTYQLQYTTNLLANPPVWAPAATTNGDGTTLTLDDAAPVDLQRYYRIVKP